MKQKCYVLILSNHFPKTHKRAGEPTEFFMKILDEVKLHTLRKNYPLWKKRVDEINAGRAYLSVRCWEGLPYRSKQREMMEFTALGIQKIEKPGVLEWEWDNYLIDDIHSDITTAQLAKNDGLSLHDFYSWFKKFPSEPMAIIHFTDFRYQPNLIKNMRIIEDQLHS